MKIKAHFLLATLSWRGLKNSPLQLQVLSQSLSEFLSLPEYQDVLSQHFLIPKSVSKTWFELSVRELDWLSLHKASWVTIFEPHYPEFFREIEYPPTILTWWGDLLKPHSEMISVVGSRRPSRESLYWMDNFFDLFLRQSRATVVSGGASGVDQKAHSLALRAGCPTIVVLPSGLNHVYPSSVLPWKSLLIEGKGAMVSALSPLVEMQKRYFVERNRYIAAWSKLTFIVEAKRRSGTMSTVNWSRRFDRSIAVLPSSPSLAGMGGLDVLANGEGVLIRDQFDLLQAFNRAAVKTSPIFSANEDQ